MLMAKKQHQADAPALSSAIAPDIDRLGLFLPYTPLHTLLLDGLQRPLVATSANRSGEPIITDGDEVLQQLGKPPLAVVDAILDHNRPIINGCDDSVVQMLDDELQVLRLARGYAPLSLPSKSLASMNIVSKSLVSKNTASKSLTNKDSGDNSSNKLPSLLAVGPQQKNTLALNIGNQLYLSPISAIFSVLRLKAISSALCRISIACTALSPRPSSAINTPTTPPAAGPSVKVLGSLRCSTTSPICWR